MPHAVEEQDVRPLRAARANGCRRWAGREVSVLGLCDWERGRGSRAGQGSASAARKCTRMPPLSVSSGGAGPRAHACSPAAPGATGLVFPPASAAAPWGQLLLPLTEGARPNAPPGLSVTGEAVGERGGVRTWGHGTRGPAGTRGSRLPRGIGGAGAGWGRPVRWRGRVRGAAAEGAGGAWRV